VGTIRKNKKELPKYLLEENRPVGSSRYAFTEDITALSYIPKRKKNVLMLSTFHGREGNIGSKPEMIHFYNSTKGGIGTVDQLISNYTCQRTTRRWLFAVFCNMLDISAINAQVLYQQVKTEPLQDRRIFIRNFCENIIASFKVSVPKPILKASTISGSRKVFCVQEKTIKKTRKRCTKCSNPVCENHCILLCDNCKEI